MNVDGHFGTEDEQAVKRLIDQKIANALAMRLIQDEKPAGKTARVELVEGDLRIALN